MADAPGIYVEIVMREDIEHIWNLTQTPALHQRWDLRFTRIEYLPKARPEDPQRFLYETRIGFGLAIRGTGESIADRSSPAGDRTSSLRFFSDDRKSLIREGSGYWRYVPTPEGLRFFTWYDYTVRFGAPGRMIDRLIFRPLMGWATAWSFDRLRLWAEQGQTPESSLSAALVHAIARCSIAAIWIWHGLVPKLIYRNVDERTMLAQAGLPVSVLPYLGMIEIAIGIGILCIWKERRIFLGNIVLMILATVAVAIRSPLYLRAAFNPITLNFAMIALSLVGWFASSSLPSAGMCRRTAPGKR